MLSMEFASWSSLAAAIYGCLIIYSLITAGTTASWWTSPIPLLHLSGPEMKQTHPYGSTEIFRFANHTYALMSNSMCFTEAPREMRTRT